MANFITDKMKAKPRGDIARAAVAAYGSAVWGRDRVAAVLEWCGLPPQVIAGEIERRKDQNRLAKKRKNEAARIARAERKAAKNETA